MPTYEYTELPERAKKLAENFWPDKEFIDQGLRRFESVKPREPDTDGSTEELNGVVFTHHFTSAPGDYEKVDWHYVTCGKENGTPILFLHGVPDSWFQWNQQMAALASKYFCVAVDLKGYGQSEKSAGDYRHEGAAEQLFALLQQIGVGRFFLASHDRGTVQADFIVANHPYNVLGYARGEQHLYHFNPATAQQGEAFRDAPYTGMMEDPKRLVVLAYTWMVKSAVPDAEIARSIQEFSYPGITHTVPRYFNSSTFRQEWIERRTRLLSQWRCPVLIMQGYDSRTQPREFFENAKDYIPNARDVGLEYIPGGHFWALESPQETVNGIKRLLTMAGENVDDV